MTGIYLVLLLLFIVITNVSLIPLRQPLSKSPNYHEIKRNLTIGKLNFLHTTDTHGWVSGHINQREYTGDFGDYYSFVIRMREKANLEGGDLVLVDTGDRHDGQGLSDMTYPNGKYSNEIFQNIPYDLITVGNHELYLADVSRFEYNNLVQFYGDRFISSNVEFLNDDDEWVTFGYERYRYFTTPLNSIRVLGLSFLFDFKGGNERVRVAQIEEVINGEWFNELMVEYKDKVDIIVLFGHIPISHEWKEVWDLQRKIREYYPDTQIQLFGGHSHIRDFSVFDEKSTGLQSGRYCETVGFLSIEDLSKDIGDGNLFRSYIDFNLHSFQYHTGYGNRHYDEEFNIERGLRISDSIKEFNEELQLSYSFGEVYHDYLLERSDYYSRDESSLLVLIEEKILPNLKNEYCSDVANQQVLMEEKNQEKNRMVIINTGAIRYDLYSGNFTKNSKFTISPFKNKWKIIEQIPISVGIELMKYLNEDHYYVAEQVDKSCHLLNSYQREINKRVKVNQGGLRIDKKSSSQITRGYVTEDDFGEEGDDTVHFKSPIYQIPNVINSFEINDPNSELIDLVFYDFIEVYIRQGLENVSGESGISKMYNNCTDFYKLSDLIEYEIEKGGGI